MKPNTWTEERITILKKLWSDGKTASHIAGRLGGLTRNAVIGKVHRLGLPGRATTVRYNNVRRKRRRAPAAVREKFMGMKPKISTMLASLPVEPLPPEDTNPPEKLFRWLDWDETACRWPYTVNNEHFYGCTCERLQGAAYCAGHARKAFKPVDLTIRKVTHHKSPEFA